MIRYLIKLKKSNFYKNFLLIIILPIYEFFWQYILNFDRKILYLLWKFKKRKFIQNSDKKYNIYDKNPLKYIEGDKDFFDLSNKINTEIENSLLEKINNRFIELKNADPKKTHRNVTSSGKVAYKFDIFDLLSEDLKNEIFNLAISDKMVFAASDYLKVFPILKKFQVYVNVPTSGLKSRGAMLWHKDDFGYKNLDFFLTVNSVDSDNGPLYALKKIDPLGVFSKSIYEIKNPVKGERGKLSNASINENENREKIVTLLGQGNAFLTDTMRVYHHGGDCKNRHRVMIRFSYQTKDCVRIKDSVDNFFYIKSISADKINSYFIKKLLFYKSGKLTKIIRGNLMKFYRLIHYKKSDFFG